MANKMVSYQGKGSQDEPEEKKCKAYGCFIYPTIDEKYCRYHYGYELKHWDKITNRLRTHDGLVNAYHLIITHNSVDWVCGDLKMKVAHLFPFTENEDFADYKTRLTNEIMKTLYHDIIKEPTKVEYKPKKPEEMEQIGEVLSEQYWNK